MWTEEESLSVSLSPSVCLFARWLVAVPEILNRGRRYLDGFGIGRLQYTLLDNFSLSLDIGKINNNAYEAQINHSAF
jgi:hypothetical protein